MSNANNFISSVQTSGIRIRITGYSFRKALETEKKYAGIIFKLGEKGNICFFVLIIRFRQFGAEKNQIRIRIRKKYGSETLLITPLYILVSYVTCNFVEKSADCHIWFAKLLPTSHLM